MYGGMYICMEVHTSPLSVAQAPHYVSHFYFRTAANRKWAELSI